MKIIAIKERSVGNDMVGDAWLETKIFEPSTPISEIINWQKNKGVGKLIITVEDIEKTS